MEGARAAWGASKEDQTGAEFEMDSLGNQVPELEQPQDPAEERRPESPENSLSLAPAKEAAGAGQDLSGGKMLPSPRPAPLRVLPPSLGYESSGSPMCRCRCREDSVLLPHAELDGDKKMSRIIKRVGLPMYMRSLRWALAVMAVLLAVLAVAVVALASKTGIRCRPCPQGWMWSEGQCYYLAAEAEAWETSQAFCSAHQATLPLLRHTQDFLSRHPVTKYSWVGARRGPQGWHWIDGTPLPPQLLPEEDQDQPDLECGCLEGGKLVASDCASPRPWVCAKGTK
nr:PREDICTED: killer cell lectin-like receptor subfamily G member 2 [Bos mutus]